MNKDLVLEKMNDWGEKKIPFLFCIDFEMLKPFVLPIAQINPSRIRYNFNGKSNSPLKYKPDSQIKIEKIPVSFSHYAEAFNEVRKNLMQGNTYLLNLTFPTEIQLNLTLDEIYELSEAPYKMWYQDEFTFFSPETFVRIKNGLITTHPMKGTIDASVDHAEKRLLNDKKELAEHHTIVDLLRNDLSMVSENVKVSRFRYLTRIKTHEKELIQMSSEISGELPENYLSKLGDIIFSLLPAGSVSGAPKRKTIEIISAVEKIRRGWYSGVCGIFDGRELDSCVMIRFIEKQNQQFFFRSGGGITLDSSVENEYKELIDKVYVPLA